MPATPSSAMKPIMVGLPLLFVAPRAPEGARGRPKAASSGVRVGGPHRGSSSGVSGGPRGPQMPSRVRGGPRVSSGVLGVPSSRLSTPLVPEPRPPPVPLTCCPTSAPRPCYAEDAPSYHTFSYVYVCLRWLIFEHFHKHPDFSGKIRIFKEMFKDPAKIRKIRQQSGKFSKIRKIRKFPEILEICRIFPEFSIFPQKM